MKNYEMLKQIAERRQIGYTTTLAKAFGIADKVKIVAHSERSARTLNDNFNTKNFTRPDLQRYRGSKDILIPDNSFLCSAIREIENKMEDLIIKNKELELKIKKLKKEL